MNKIKILIVDDDEIWLKCLTKLVNRHSTITIVGCAKTREDAVNIIRTSEIDIVIMDLNLGITNFDGINAIIDILEIKKMKIIVLTSFSEKDMVLSAYSSGAVNYLCKDNYKLLPEVIKSTYNTFTPIEILISEYNFLKNEYYLKDLTTSEREVFELKKEGMTVKEISSHLHKSISTLKKQVNQILKKLKVTRFDDINKNKY